MRRSFGVPDERWLLPGPIFKLAKPFKATVAKVFRDTFAQFKNLFKKPPKPQIKPSAGKPKPSPTCKAPNSFTGDTVVLMADGTSKPIRDVQLGDKVIATDPETGQGARVVTALIRHGGDHDMVKITTGAGTVIHATDEHPFWDTIDQEWVNAEDLTTTDVLVTAAGTEVHVASVSTYVEDVLAYNLTVDDLHTYHVSDADILVHNCNTDETYRTRQVDEYGNRITNAAPAPKWQTDQMAAHLGYKPTGQRVDGKPVYREGRSYIVQDTTSHVGGFWKMGRSVADLGSQTTRSGTYGFLLHYIAK